LGGADIQQNWDSNQEEIYEANFHNFHIGTLKNFTVCTGITQFCLSKLCK